MRDENRIDPMLQAVGEYWHKYPDLRLGQIIANCLPTQWSTPDPFYIEDITLMQGLQRLMEDSE